MKNTLKDLNNYLFEQLERLNDDDCLNNDFDKEMKRSKAVTNVCQQIINLANTELKIITALEEQGISKEKTPEILKLEKK